MKIEITSWDNESILAQYEGKMLPEIIGEFNDYREVCEAVLDEIDRIHGITASQRMVFMRWLLNDQTPEERRAFLSEIGKKGAKKRWS